MLYVSLLFLYSGLWETDKVQKTVQIPIEKFAEMSFHTPSSILRQKMIEKKHFEVVKLFGPKSVTQSRVDYKSL